MWRDHRIAICGKFLPLLHLPKMHSDYPIRRPSFLQEGIKRRLTRCFGPQLSRKDWLLVIRFALCFEVSSSLAASGQRGGDLTQLEVLGNDAA
jgi:hypothetical protein